MKLGPYFVDGYAERGGDKWVWEFQGCFFHGCPTCYRSDEICPLTGTRYGDLHAASEARLSEPRGVYGVRTIVMWEHDWTEMKKSHEEVKKFLKTYVCPEQRSL